MLGWIKANRTQSAFNYLLPAHALVGGMSMWDGRDIADVQTSLVTGEDRSAGRWCDHCGQVGSHHTDRHVDFLIVQVTVTPRGDMVQPSETFTFNGSDLVSMTDFPSTRTPGREHALAQSLN